MQFTINRKSVSRISLFIILTFTVAIYQYVSIKGTATYLEYVGLALLIFIFSRSSRVEILGMVMFLLPSNQYINLGSTSIITILVTLFFLKMLVVDKKMIYTPLLLLGMTLICYSALFGALGTISTAIKILLYLFFCLDVFTDTNTNIKQKFTSMVKFLVTGIIIAACFSILFQSDIFSGRFSLTEEQSTNTLGILTGYAIGFILMLTQSKYMGSKWLYSIIPLTIVGFLTQSRSFIFIAFIALVWCLIFALGKCGRKANIRFLIMSIGIGLLFFIIMSSNEIWAEVINNALERITNPRNDDISNGRFYIWRYYIDEVINNKHILFFGKGIIMSSSLAMLAHNIWLEQLYIYGLVGNTIIILMFWVSIKYIYKKLRFSKLSFYGLLPLTMIFASSFFSHTFIGGSGTITFFLAVIAVGLFSKKPKMV